MLGREYIRGVMSWVGRVGDWLRSFKQRSSHVGWHRKP